MADWKNLTEKTIRTLREDGFRKVGEKAKLYLKRKSGEKAENCYTQGCFRDVLFINGCDEHLPHPGRYRVAHQREQLEALGMSTGEVYYQNLQIDTMRCYRIFIFFRCPYTDEIGEFIARAKKLNKTIFYDVDDLVIDTAYTDMIPYLVTLGEQEREAYDDHVRNMGRLLKLCDGAITTTGGLAQELEQMVPEVLVNRNVASEEMVALSLRALQKKQELQDGEPDTSAKKAGESGSDGIPGKKIGQVRLGYFSGSITHNDDFQMILPVLVKLMEKYETLSLHLVGELDLPEALRSFQERIVVHPFTDWRKLPEMIAQVDINLAPLENTIFNRAKSENKWVEAALVKVPTVASDIGAFHEMVENGKTGILCRDAEQWEEALSALIEQPQYRLLIGQTAFDFCSRACVTANTGRNLLEFLQAQSKETIAFLLPGFQISGGVMVALQHCGILQEEGRDVLLLSIDERGKEKWYEFEHHLFPVLNCNDLRLYGSIDGAVATMWSTVDWLWRYPTVRRRAYLVQNYEPDFYEPGDPRRMQARKTYGDHPDLWYLTISKWCQEWLEQQYGHPTLYAPNGLDLEKFTAKPEVSGEAEPEAGREASEEGRRIRVLIEGDSSAFHKNVDESFRIAEKLEKEKYEIWYMAYHGTPKDWYRVDRFLPQVPYSQVQEVYQQCDILLKSSVLESFSYPPLEMMASGGCAVAVLNEGNREYLKDGENCLCYPLGDIEKGAEAVRRVAEDEALRQRLKENGRKTAQERDWKRIRKDILRLYQW